MRRPSSGFSHRVAVMLCCAMIPLAGCAAGGSGPAAAKSEDRGQADVVPAGVTLRSWPEVERVRTGEPVWIRIRLVNGGTCPLGYGASSPAYDYHLTVLLPDGRGEAPLTLLGHQLRDSGVVRQMESRRLAPGASLEERLLVNGLYDVSLPGTYAVTVSRAVAGDAGKAVMVTAPPIRFKVTSWGADGTRAD